MACGYTTMHVCCEGQVKFISRYRGDNDYCVGGRRTTLTDDGQLRQGGQDVSTADLELLRAFLLNEYADYVRWYDDNRHWLGETTPMQAFGHKLPAATVQS